MHTIHQKINHKTCPFTLLKLFSFVLFLVFSLTSPQKIFAAEQSQWQSQEVESKDVLIWTKTVPNSDFKAFKGQVTIAAPLNKVLAVIKNLQHYPEWYHQNKLTKRLQVINKQQNLNYTVTKTPWPVSDRDSVILSTQKELSNGAIKIELTAQPNSYPLQPDMVRIEKLSGYWLLEKVSDKRFSENEITQITLEISAEPGGQIPSWVANNMVIDMPFYTLTNLKERLENSY